MKKLMIILLAYFIVISCKTDKKEDVKKEFTVESSYRSFGEKIFETDFLTSHDAFQKYKELKVGDTVTMKFASTIDDLCSKKGCWMKLPLGEEQVMVRFKDYAFFMPLDSKGKEVIVEGKAFVQKISVDELKHYAEDAGQSKDEIAKITEPKTEFSFEAHGVLMKK